MMTYDKNSVSMPQRARLSLLTGAWKFHLLIKNGVNQITHPAARMR